ncbi:hypothetical protein OYT40_002163 [Escherichia coli]|nr:hypothetical protein [Escherichia coli]
MSTVLHLTATTEFSSFSAYTISTQPTADTKTVTDAMSKQPRVVSIQGVIVPTIMSVLAELADLIDGKYENRGSNVNSVTDFVDTVERWRAQRQVMTIHLPENLEMLQCVITGFECSRDKTNSNGLNVQMQFTEIVSFPQRVGQNTATVKGGAAGSGSVSSSVKTTSKGSVTSKVDAGRLSTTDGSSMKFCNLTLDKETTYEGHSVAADNAMSGCVGARSSTATLSQKNAAEAAARDNWKNLGGNNNKLGFRK